jgi:hypothetical protein
VIIVRPTLVRAVANVHGSGNVRTMPDEAATFPAPGTEITHILVVQDIERSTAW